MVLPRPAQTIPAKVAVLLPPSEIPIQLPFIINAFGVSRGVIARDPMAGTYYSPEHSQRNGLCDFISPYLQLWL